jgi:hypothetical protein
MSPTARSSKMTNEAVAFVVAAIVLGMIFSADLYGLVAGIVMLLLAAFEYFRGPIGGVGA